ncbi:MAG: SDH family Clp fold serine proteinase [Planctomycetota bacterium]
MEASIFFWLFVLIAVLQPVVSRRLRESSRANLARRIESRRKSRVVAVTTSEESMRFLGFPLSRRLEVAEPEAVLRALELTAPELPVDIVLHVPEGVGIEAAQIARAIRRHGGRVTALVPHFARSGSALLAFAADEIVMSPNAVLGSVSPWVDGRPAASILRVAREAKGALSEDGRILADRAERAIARSKDLLRELLEDKFPRERAERLAAALAEGDWSDRELSYEDLAAAGFPVRKDLPCEVLQLTALYPQPARCPTGSA